MSPEQSTSSVTSSPQTPVLVYGLGRSGLAMVRRLRAAGTETTFYEQRPQGADVSEALALGARRIQSVNMNDAPSGSTPSNEAPLVVAAPGVPIDHPDLQRLRAGGSEVIGEVEWAWRNVPGRYLGVTGTAGKGSVTRWCTDTLQSAGLDAVAGGNIVPALAAVARPGAVHVVEMSSFQLERCPTFAPQVAVVLNLGEDHIDRHGSVATYHAAKRNLIKNLRAGATFVANGDDPIVASWAEEAAREGIETQRFSLHGEADAYRDSAGQLWLHGRRLLDQQELQVLGDHQVANGLATALACAALGVEHDAIAAGLQAFRGLPGRYEPAGNIGEVRFLEDSIATRPLAVAAALSATAKPLVWIAGGQGKGVNLAELKPLVVEQVDLLIAIGANRSELIAAYGDKVPTRICAEPNGRAALRCAVAEALAYLGTKHSGCGNVLLAPLAASFDQFTDYADRGAAFREAVAAAAVAAGGGGAEAVGSGGNAADASTTATVAHEGTR